MKPHEVLHAVKFNVARHGNASLRVADVADQSRPNGGDSVIELPALIPPEREAVASKKAEQERRKVEEGEVSWTHAVTSCLLYFVAGAIIGSGWLYRR